MDPLTEAITAATIATMDRRLTTLGLLPRLTDASDVETPPPVAPHPAPVVPSVDPPPAAVLPSVLRAAPLLAFFVPNVASITQPPTPIVLNVASVLQPPAPTLSNAISFVPTPAPTGA